MRDDGAVLLIRRAKAMPFFGDAFAFPGGRVDPEDVTPSASHSSFWLGHHFCPVAPSPSPNLPSPNLSHDFPTSGSSPNLSPNLSHDFLASAYARCAQREAMEEVGLDVPLVSLRPWARWITPEAEGRRFDTMFFVAPLPPGEVVLNPESSEFRLVAPKQALQEFAAEQLRLPPPTVVVLAELAQTLGAAAGSPTENPHTISRSPYQAIADRAQTPIPEVLPVLQQGDGSVFILLPGDPGNPAKQYRPWPAPITPKLRLDGWPPKFSFLA